MNIILIGITQLFQSVAMVEFNAKFVFKVFSQEGLEKTNLILRLLERVGIPGPGGGYSSSQK